ncbi:MAG: nucleotidyltransferase domain-containing protein [Chitinophagaceae bacterium]
MEKIIENKLPEIKKTFQKYGATRAYLFGSAATDSMTKDSDIDFLFSFPKDMHYETYGANYFELLYDLQELLNRNVDLVAEKTLSNPFLIESINESKIRIM